MLTPEAKRRSDTQVADYEAGQRAVHDLVKLKVKCNCICGNGVRM